MRRAPRAMIVYFKKSTNGVHVHFVAENGPFGWYGSGPLKRGREFRTLAQAKGFARGWIASQRDADVKVLPDLKPERFWLGGKPYQLQHLWGWLRETTC